MELDPENSSFLYNTGLLHTKRGDFENAEESLLKAKKIDSQNPFIYMALGSVYESKEEPENALSTYLELQELNPNIDGLDKKIAYLKSAIKMRKEQDEHEARQAEAERKRLEDEQKAKDKQAKMKAENDAAIEAAKIKHDSNELTNQEDDGAMYAHFYRKFKTIFIITPFMISYLSTYFIAKCMQLLRTPKRRLMHRMN